MATERAAHDQLDAFVDVRAAAAAAPRTPC
jgi:hypothetical protein